MYKNCVDSKNKTVKKRVFYETNKKPLISLIKNVDDIYTE